MDRRFFALLVLALMWLAVSAAKKSKPVTMKKLELEPEHRALGVLDEAVTTFDYDYIPLARKSSKSAKSYSTTTQRPLVRYWNTLMRNVRLPTLPTITWNMTNPFVNLFNNGEANIIETPVADYDTHNYGAEPDRKKSRNRTRRRKSDLKKHTPAKRVRQKKHRHYLDATYSHYVDDEGLHLQRPLYVAPYYYEPYRAQQYDNLHSRGQFVPYYYSDYDVGDDLRDDVPVSMPTTSEEAAPTGDAIVAPTNEQNDELMASEEDENAEDEADISTQISQTLPASDVEPTDAKADDTAEETVRNAIGSFMADDPWTMKRQRANTKRKPTKARITPKTMPKSIIQLFYVQPW